MPKTFSVIISPAAEWCLQDIESFKMDSIGAIKAAEFADNLLISNVTAIVEDPKRYRYNGMLADKGFLFRERLDAQNEYRTIYDFDDSQVQILLFISMKQDVVKTLYRYLITR